MNRQTLRRPVAVLAAVMLAGCAASSGHRAPVVDHSFSPGGSVAAAAGTSAVMPVQRERMQHEKDWRPQVYVVQKGDTLYSIALNFGFDYHELADINGIENPGMIRVGQEIRLFPAAGAAATASAIKAEPAVVPVKSQPQVSKLPYSAQAAAQIEQMQAETVKAVEIAAPPPVKPVSAATAAAAGGEEDDAVQWGMPASGKVVAGFSEADSRKGIDIAGALGQPVSASAAGKVVYSGSGLRGYGNLVIIKHNSTYLSAYAHNSKILVKEGQMVSRGQKIAEMGSSDASRVALHFEIRRLGKPVDPAKYLPLPRS